MVYGLTTIGKVEWYEWGSKILVRTQNRDGSWATNSHGTVGQRHRLRPPLLCPGPTWPRTWRPA